MEKPITATFIAKSHFLPLGRVSIEHPVDITATNDISIIVILNFGFLSSIIERIKEPPTPKIMKIPPQRALSTGL